MHSPMNQVSLAPDHYYGLMESIRRAAVCKLYLVMT